MLKSKFLQINFSLCFILFILVGQIYSKVINVPGDAATIQGGIDMSESGDTVLVAPGTYIENINFNGKNIHLASHFILDGNRQKIVETIIDGGSPSSSDIASCVRIISGEDRTAILEGFTLTNGKGTKWVDEHGAGTYIEGGGVIITLSSPTIRNNIITNNNVARVARNVVSAGGGGIRIGDGSPLIENNIITHNVGMYGGGIVSNYATPVIKNNVVAYNSVIEVDFRTPTYGGGGIWTTGPSNLAEIYNNIIVNNSANDGNSSPGASGYGGGLLLFGKSKVKNNIVWGNVQQNGHQVDDYSGSQPSYNCIEEWPIAGTNITADPKFIDETYQLATDSPCIDAGDPDAAFNDLEDQANTGSALFPAMGTLLNDMGIYGGQTPMPLLSSPTSVESENNIPGNYFLAQNYPNPFNPSTTITFGLKENSLVQISVYNTIGELVDSIVNKEFSRGIHSINYKPTHLTSGVYFYTLQVNNSPLSVKKLILMK